MAIVMLQWGCAVDRWRLLGGCEHKVAVREHGPPVSLAVCQACRCAHYCSPFCQAVHWAGRAATGGKLGPDSHRGDCVRIRQMMNDPALQVMGATNPNNQAPGLE